ncbi:hypothetical protein COT51_00480 [candidate division WWE3 bacterium CG08_land_8_20_14_0_20_41_15]|uniref:DNA 3'-5' helicase n=1 Tax=candidate division WWE3 bacterium CG08_land_8_20_14_0_20_41_15 TaxID=1975086 RepID=A0A2H0XCL9_UNCKA|nr:MAG: hypothetical protein COT51_00480 [candidate division WWE3 bacterium CG08_land_8_20_14_0_20_41_15]
MELNVNQKKAIYHESGPLLVVAGAGTGKTRVITERIKFLIEEQKINPQHILALTFTEKAAGEMLSRVDESMPLGYEEPWLSTFHSFADRILREEALSFGLDPSYKILTRPQEWLLIRENLFKFELDYYRPLGNPTKFISAMITYFSRLQDENISPEEFIKFANESAKLKTQSSKPQLKAQNEDNKYTELAKTYKTYQDLKLQKSVFDFGDLIVWTIKLFKERPQILKKYREQFEHILVDEFQDTNFAQYELIKTLAPADKNPNLIVVGDDDQSIYKFRGASVANILSFKKDYPKAETVVLTENYRSDEKILDAAYKLIRHNDPDRLEVKLGIEKKLKAQSSKRKTETQNAKLNIVTSSSAEEEAHLVVNEILKLRKENEYSWKDFAILARANSHLEPFVLELKKQGIPYQLLGNRGLFDQEEVRDAGAGLKVIADLTDSASLYRLLTSQISPLENSEVIKIVSNARRKKSPLWEELKLYQQESKNGGNLISLIERERERITKALPSEILFNFITQSGYLKPLVEEESTENSLKIRNLNLFLQRVKSYESEQSRANLLEFLDFLKMLEEAGENPAQAEIEDIDTVNLLTVHSAKGLEFPVVFMVNLVAGRFPTRNRGEAIEFPEELVKEALPEGDYHIEEERRLFYVGMTRAKDLLYLSFAKNYGGARDSRPSGFIEETGLKIPELTAKEKKSQLSLFQENDLKLNAPSSQLLSTNYPIPPFLSYSQLETFGNCPLQYKYRYVLGIPQKESHVLNFGQTLHRTLRDFHKEDLFSKNTTLERLLDLYEGHWIDTGFDSKEQKEMRKEQGRTLLKAYFESFPKKLGSPIFIEKKFTVKIGGVDVIGSIDRIDKTTEGIEIVDYKTGSLKDQKEVDKNSQLAIYAIAAKEALKIEPTTLSLYFLEHNEKLTTRRTDLDLEKKKEEVKKTIEEIGRSDFPAKPSMLCKYCDFKSLCPEYKVESQ